MPDASPAPAPKPGVVPWLVGLFALWQLVFPILTNLMEFVPLRPTKYDLNPPFETTQKWGRFTDFEPLQITGEVVGRIVTAWGEFSGQDQGWNMFTPAFP